MTQTLASIARIAGEARVLDQIRENSCSIAIWQREPLPDIAGHLPASVREVRFTASLNDLPATLVKAMRSGGYRGKEPWDTLRDDIIALAQHYGRILHLQDLEVRLEVVTTDACRKFHADFVTARLITTYCGQGTQWLEAEDAQAVAEGEEPRRINTLSAGDVGLFKGKLATRTPAVHRSPPISGTGERRLLLVLNPPVEG